MIKLRSLLGIMGSIVKIKISNYLGAEVYAKVDTVEAILVLLDSNQLTCRGDWFVYGIYQKDDYISVEVLSE